MRRAGDGIYFREFAITGLTGIARGTSMSNRPSIFPKPKRMTSSRAQSIINNPANRELTNSCAVEVLGDNQIR